MHGAQQHLWIYADSLQKCIWTRIYTYTYTCNHVGANISQLSQMGFVPFRNYLVRQSLNGTKPIWLSWLIPTPTTSHCEVTHETEPVIMALPDQGIVSRARDAPLYGSFPPVGIVQYWLMIAFITCKSSLVTLLEGLCTSNPCRFEFSVFKVFSGNEPTTSGLTVLRSDQLS